MIDRQTINRIMDAANIVDVVGEFVTLRKAGSNYKGLCPFHDEKTPSFVVSPARNMCHCFGCGKGGTPVGFIMEHEQMTYPEALRWLAKKYHIEIVEKELTEDEKEEQTNRESMFIVNEWAMKYYEDMLYNTVDGKAIGMAYFRSRGFRDDIIQKFHLGYAPNTKDALAKKAKEDGYKEKYLLATGLCFQKENGKVFDRYYGRVIFPWLSVSGKVCAFGGRVLDSRTKGVNQKYVNSPDSEIYHKSNELYGLFQAKKAIIRNDMVYMVEGYTDVVSMHQCGVENVVANSGTALSMAQIRLLHRFTSNITLLYDGDNAGIHAALRGTDMLLSESMNVKIVLLPDGDDPDSFARKHTAEEYQQYIDANAQDFILFKIKVLLEGVTDPIKKSEAINDIVKSISEIPDQIKRATYVREFAQRIGMDEKTIIYSMNEFIRTEHEEKVKRQNNEQNRTLVANGDLQSQSESHTTVANDKKNSRLDVEDLLIREVVRYGDVVIYKDVPVSDGTTLSFNVAQFIRYDLEQDGMQFSNTLYNMILDIAVRYTEQKGKTLSLTDYLIKYPDIDISRIAARMSMNRYHLSKSLEYSEKEEEVRDHVHHMLMDFKIKRFEIRIKELNAALKKQGIQISEMKDIMNELKQCQENRNLLAKELGFNIRN